MFWLLCLILTVWQANGHLRLGLRYGPALTIWIVSAPVCAILYTVVYVFYFTDFINIGTGFYIDEQILASSLFFLVDKGINRCVGVVHAFAFLAIHLWMCNASSNAGRTYLVPHIELLSTLPLVSLPICPLLWKQEAFLPFSWVLGGVLLFSGNFQ